MQGFTPVPTSLIDDRGDLRYGVFEGPLPNVDMADFRLPCGPVRLPAAVSRFRLKEWQHYWVANDEVFFGFAFVDAKYLHVSFAYVYDTADRTFVEHKVDGLRPAIHLPRALFDERGHFRAPGHVVEVHNHLAADTHTLTVAIAAKDGKPGFSADLTLAAETAARRPLEVNVPLPGGGGMYSHKAILKTTGELRVGDKTYTFTPATTRTIVDVHKAHYPYRTFWRWATFWGFTDDGRECGINLTDNVGLQPETYNECAFWLDGELVRLGPAQITHPPTDMCAPWQVGTRDGAVQLVFTPAGERAEDLVVGPIVSRFHQPYGTYAGVVTLPDGRRITVARGWGVAEDHTSRW